MTPGRGSLREVDACVGDVVVLPLAPDPSTDAAAAQPSAPATPSSAANLKRLNLSGSARRVLASANAAAVVADEPASVRMSANRSTGDHVLNRRPQQPLTPALKASGSDSSLPHSSARPGSALKSGAKRITAAAPVPPSPVNAPVFRASQPTHSPRGSATPQPPQPQRTPSRISLALEELSALGYTPSCIGAHALGGAAPIAEGHGSGADRAQPPQPQEAHGEDEHLSTPPGMATPPGSPAQAAPAQAEAADGARPLGQAGGAGSAARAGRAAERVAVPFALPPAGSAADAAAVGAIGKALLQQAEAAQLSARKPKRAAHELEGAGGGGPSCAALYAIAKVPRSAHKEMLGAERAVTPVRRSARWAPRTPRGPSAREPRARRPLQRSPRLTRPPRLPFTAARRAPGWPRTRLRRAAPTRLPGTRACSRSSSSRRSSSTCPTRRCRWT